MHASCQDLRPFPPSVPDLPIVLPELALLPPLSFLLSTVSILQLIGLMTPGRMDEQNLKFPFELGQKQIWALISVLSGDSDYANLN